MVASFCPVLGGVQQLFAKSFLFESSSSVAVPSCFVVRLPSTSKIVVPPVIPPSPMSTVPPHDTLEVRFLSFAVLCHTDRFRFRFLELICNGRSRLLVRISFSASVSKDI